MDYGLLLEDEDNLDASPSEPLEITLPKNMDGESLIYFKIFVENGPFWCLQFCTNWKADYPIATLG
jgi:hypothetical protein